MLKLCERVVILRDGAVVGDDAASSFTHEKLVSLMVGRQVNNVFPEKDAVQLGQPRLQVKNLSLAAKGAKVATFFRNAGSPAS